MSKIKTFANSGTLLPNDVDAVIFDAAEVHRWRTSIVCGFHNEYTGVDFTDSVGQRHAGFLSTTSTFNTLAAITPGTAAFPIITEESPDDPWETVFRLRATVALNGLTAFPGTFSYGVAPISVASGVYDDVSWYPDLAGSSVLVTPPPGVGGSTGGSFSMEYSGEFVAPASGLYAFTMVPSAPLTSNNPALISLLSMQYRRRPRS